jgi:outer membrane biosynthesis protein TonB
VDVVRSLPPFDEAASAAARQWEYEITKVDGKPVPVRLTVPITFALKLPELTREPGIPELRQGVSPPFPSDAPAAGTMTVTADVTIDPSGQVVEAEVKSGESPWTEALLIAMRTWRFTPTGTDRLISFQVRADFVPARGGTQRVELKLSGLRQGEEVASHPADPAPPAGSPAGAATAANPPAEPPAAQPAPALPAPATTSPPPAPTPPPTPAPAAGTPATTAPANAPPASTAPPANTPPANAPSTNAPSTNAPADDAPAATPAANAPRADTPPANTPHANAPAPAQPSRSASPSDQSAAPAPPPVEVIPPAPEPPKPVEPGVSAVQDVLLGPGVPDLSRGRRPVAPPVARMNNVSGNVEVRFVVEASGASSVRDVEGPEMLKEAARQTVASWMFRRTTPERLPLVAVFGYIGDRATASVKVAE